MIRASLPLPSRKGWIETRLRCAIAPRITGWRERSPEPNHLATSLTRAGTSLAAGGRGGAPPRPRGPPTPPPPPPPAPLPPFRASHNQLLSRFLPATPLNRR